MSASSSVLELRLLPRSSSNYSKFFHPRVGKWSMIFKHLTVIISDKKLFIRLSSVLKSTVDLRVSHVGGGYSQRAGVLRISRWILGEFEFCRSLISFGLPWPNVLFFTVALSGFSSTVGLFLFGDGASGSLSDSIIYTFVCFDGDFVKRPSVRFLCFCCNPGQNQ